MVKEVEAHNMTAMLQPGYELSPETYPEVITADLSSNGLTLTAKVNRILAPGFTRRVSLVYLLPQYEQQMMKEYALGSFGPSLAYTPATEYVFDLGPVMTQIIHNPPEQMADDTINVRLYTYESNVPFNYGTCYPTWDPIVAYTIGDYVQYADRLWQCKANNIGEFPSNSAYWQYAGVPSSGTISINLPYTVSYPGFSVMPTSTDGLYEIRVIDVAVYDDNVSYRIGDIVQYGGGYNMCIKEPSLGNNPTDDEYWSTPAAEDVAVFYAAGWDPNHTTVTTILVSDLLITRYIKQKFIYELLVKSNYKKYDNIQVVSDLEKIMAMREAAVAHLHMSNPIAARYMLDMITIEANSLTVNKGERTTVGLITNFTI